MLIARNLNWKRDPNLHPIFAPARLKLANYAPVDLTSKFPLAPFDQGQEGSCTANAMVGYMNFLQARMNLAVVMLSRQFQYWNERNIEGSISDDSGSTITDTLTAADTCGICPEVEWPYDADHFTLKPTPQCFQDALACVGIKSSRVPQTLDGFFSVWESGLPIIAGISVYQSFMDGWDAGGVIPIPNTRSEELLGGHALLFCGGDVGKDISPFRNSWGPTGGRGDGYGTIPLKNYLLNPDLASDFWVVEAIAGANAASSA